MTRITENQLSRTNLLHISQNRQAVSRYSNEVDTGYKVTKPGDSDQAAIVAQYQGVMQRIDSYRNRTASVKSSLGFQEEALAQVSDLINRAKEIAAQGGNETNGVTARAQLAEEVFQIRDNLVSLANSKYQGKYVWGGADDDDPPYDAALYTNPATGPANQRWVFDAEAGTSVTRSVNVTEELSITTNTPANGIFDNAIYAIERLGRALAGYETLPATGAPTGGGVAYTFPAQFSAQTTAIRESMDLLETARASNIETERVSVAARQRRLDTAESLLQLTQTNAQTVLDQLQNADVIESASLLTQAQTVLEASLAVSARVLNQSIIDYL
jgi:flagellar hook-associated protein 3 FlgL